MGKQSLLQMLTATTEGALLCADEKLSAFVEFEREVLTVTFYLESVQRR
jgi:hypothetical protein